MTTMNLDTINLPKYCELDRIKKDASRFVDYHTKAKGHAPDRLLIHGKYESLFAKAIKASDDLKRDYTNCDYQLMGLPVRFA